MEERKWKKNDTAAYLERRHHLPFFFAVKKVVMILQGDEGRQVMSNRVVLARSHE
jgi:hypothetical protein